MTRTWAIPDRTLRRFSILKMVWNFLHIINPLKSKTPRSATFTLQEVLLSYLRTQRTVVRISAFSCGRSQDTIHPPLQASSSIHSTAAIWMTCRSPVENKMIFLISYLFSYCKGIKIRYSVLPVLRFLVFQVVVLPVPLFFPVT